jgi:hypothetical protein
MIVYNRMDRLLPLAIVSSLLLPLDFSSVIPKKNASSHTYVINHKYVYGIHQTACSFNFLLGMISTLFFHTSLPLKCSAPFGLNKNTVDLELWPVPEGNSNLNEDPAHATRAANRICSNSALTSRLSPPQRIYWQPPALRLTPRHHVGRTSGRPAATSCTCCQWEGAGAALPSHAAAFPNLSTICITVLSLILAVKGILLLRPPP